MPIAGMMTAQKQVESRHIVESAENQRFIQMSNPLNVLYFVLKTMSATSLGVIKRERKA